MSCWDCLQATVGGAPGREKTNDDTVMGDIFANKKRRYQAEGREGQAMTWRVSSRASLLNWTRQCLRLMGDVVWLVQFGECEMPRGQSRAAPPVMLHASHALQMWRIEPLAVWLEAPVVVPQSCPHGLGAPNQEQSNCDSTKKPYTQPIFALSPSQRFVVAVSWFSGLHG
jgi:hypothetical protein